MQYIAQKNKVHQFNNRYSKNCRIFDCERRINMAQLIVTVEDVSLLSDLKKAIKMLRGVDSISVRKTEHTLNKTTLRAMQDAKERRTVKCKSFEDYLEKVK